MSKNRDLIFVIELENSMSNKILNKVDIMIAEIFETSVADLLMKM